MPELTPYHRLFYGMDGKRVLEVELSPLSLAIWFMDDGSRSRNAVYLNTQQFKSDDQVQLLRLLHEQWGIEGSLNRDKNYHRIRISVTGTTRLMELIEPLVLPSLRYKLPQVTP